jgi:hypothetical protein
MAFTEKRLAGPTALTANTETNLYVCPTAQTTTTQIKQILVTNTGSATTFDLSLVPLGGTAGTANRLFSALALSANETVLLDVSQVMSSGDFISAKSGAGSTVNVTISGVENSGLMVISGLADSAVTTAKIADGNITVEKLGPDIFADIFQSNVVTSTTRPTAPFEGQMIYETDTNRVLVWDNAAWVMIADTDQPPGLQKITPTTVAGSGVSLSGSNVVFTSAANISVNGVFSANYDFYKVIMYLAPTSGSPIPQFKYRTNGTDNSDASYTHFTRTLDSAAGAIADSFGRTQTIGRLANATSTGQSLVWEIQVPFDSTLNTISQTNGATPFANFRTGAQGFVANASFDGFSIIPSTASYTGKLSVYGYRD